MNDNESIIRPIHYLGSKLRMLDTIKEAVDKVDPNHGPICDLFAGSGTVAKYMIQYRNVIAADIQNYTSVLCEASVKKLEESICADAVIEKIKHSSTYDVLNDAFHEIVGYEEKALKKLAKDDIGSAYEIIEKGSIFIQMNDPHPLMSDDLRKALLSTIESLMKGNIDRAAETMITRYYGGLYFSYKQAVDLDAIATYAFSQEGLFKTKLIGALLSTTSEIVNTVGKQFAQPLKVENSNGQYKNSLKGKILQDRELDTFSIFKEWVAYYLSAGTDDHSLFALCLDYKDTINQLRNENVGVVYADPPYTRYHYSRYYHVLETICLRDNPKITTTFPNGKGGISRAIYREGRHQSPFCIKSQAEAAFEELFRGVSSLNVPLVLSYSPFDASKAVTPRLRTIDQLIGMAEEYYQNVDVMSPGVFTHSKLNSTDKNFESSHEAELLILCY